MKRANRLVILAWFCLAVASGLSALDLPALQLTKSVLLTHGTPDAAPGSQSEPKVIATASGYCASWYDMRQGGAIMAARLAADGTLLDPLGVPVSPVESDLWQPWKVDIIADESRCTVLHGSGTRVMGRSFALDGAPETQSKVLFETGTSYFEIAAVHERLAVIAEHYGWGAQLTLIDTEGTIYWSHAIEESFYTARVTLEGTTAWTFLQAPDRKGFLSLFRVDFFGATRFDTSVASSSINRWGATAYGDSLVIVDLDPVENPAQIRVDRTSKVGRTLRSTMVTGLPADSWLQQLWSVEGSAHALVTSSDGTRLLDIRESQDVAVTSLPGVSDAAIAEGGNRLSIWQGEDKLITYGFGLPSQAHGEAITNVFRAEVVADAVAIPDGIAVLWLEVSGEVGALLQGIVSGEDLALGQVETLADGVDSRWPRAAIMTDGEQVVTAWIDGYDLKVRWRSPDGEWTGEEQTISSSAATLHADGLTPFADGVLLLWSDFVDPEVQSGQRIRAVIVRSDGTTTSLEPGDALPVFLSWPAAAYAQDGVFVVAIEQQSVQCPILCVPQFELVFMHMSETGVWTMFEAPRLYTDGIPSIVGNGDTLFLLDWWMWLFRVTGGALIEEFDRGPFTQRSSGAFWNGRLHVASHRAGEGTSFKTELSRVRDAEEVVETEVTIPDMGSRLDFAPRLVTSGDRLYLVSSEVSLEPGESMVRRLRVHVVEPEVVRRRGVHR